MAEADRQRWEERYAAGVHPEREPEPFVLAVAARAPRPGRALDVACGRGRHALALAGRGWEVDAVDIAPTALADARRRPGGRAVRWIEADLDGWRPAEEGYDLVVCVDYTDASLLPRLVAALRPGGTLVYVARPRARCSYGPAPGEVAAWFSALTTVAHEEDGARIRYAGRRER